MGRAGMEAIAVTLGGDISPSSASTAAAPTATHVGHSAMGQRYGAQHYMAISGAQRYGAQHYGAQCYGAQHYRAIGGAQRYGDINGTHSTIGPHYRDCVPPPRTHTHRPAPHGALHEDW